jgi:hypothetical protein
MSDYVCVIQEGQAADQRREALAEGMKNIGAECFGDDPAAIASHGPTYSWGPLTS